MKSPLPEGSILYNTSKLYDWGPLIHRKPKKKKKVIAFHEALFEKHSLKIFSTEVHLVLLNENLFFPEPQFSK